MRPFSYTKARDVSEAVAELARDETARFIAGGTNLLDLMKYDVERPTRLVDITGLPLDRIEETDDGGLSIGALVRNTDIAYDARIEARYPLLSSAILAGASPQLRNSATTGGNLRQRTRCSYFYDTATPCNKREPGSGCPAKTGFARYHAILGASKRCIATHPSDMCVAMVALDATVRVDGPDGARTIPFADFHRLPGETPQVETLLGHGEIIVAVDLPAAGFAQHYSYLKIRDRLSYAFALVSVAAALEIDGDTVARARLAMGGVAAKPWRDPEAEAAMRGRPANAETFAAAADIFLAGADPVPGNAFKVDLAHRAIVRALSQAAAATPQSQTDKRIQ
ncbi:FAD binding domain-containing protein [Amorphus sp. MBR-141]